MPIPFKSVVGLGVFTTVQVTPSTAWTYADTAWTEGTCAETYSQQSPIDVVVAAVADGAAQTPPQAFNFDFEGLPDSATTSQIEGGLVVNDHTWELEWDVNDVATDKYGVQVGDKLYRLRQFHYHSPSEHTVNGDHYDMEAHHVHFCEGISCETEDPNDEILVVAVFLRVGAVNSYMQTFWNEYSPGTEPQISGLPNPYTNFMPSDKSYYSYLGSTTTPPCAQNVLWRLLTHPVEMSQAQLDAYHASVNTLNQPHVPPAQPAGVSAGWTVTTATNNRPVQELGDRVVLSFTQTDSSAADPAEPSAFVAEEDPAAADSRSYIVPALIAAAAAALLLAGVCVFMNAGSKAPPKKRAVKKTPPKEAPKEETVPLMPPPPPLLAAPNLSMVVPAQPLMQAMPQAYTTAVPQAYAMAPQYGPASVVLQP